MINQQNHCQLIMMNNKTNEVNKILRILNYILFFRNLRMIPIQRVLLVIVMENPFHRVLIVKTSNSTARQHNTKTDHQNSSMYYYDQKLLLL